MPEVDDFFLLKEYDSLGRAALAAESLKDEELARLKRREGELAERTAHLEAREAQNREMNHRMAELDRLMSQRLAPEALARAEEEGLNILVEQQHLELLIEEDRTFIAGFSQSIAEIREEVNSKIAAAQLEQKRTQERQASIAPQLPDGWLVSYQKIAAKKPPHGVFSRIQNLQCQFCRYSVSKIVESEVDTKCELRSCGSCGRLFLPYKAVAG
jgi:predicted  nucleic acid-binding Zn-ribbon protein